jgi:hypothetical protein
MKCVMMLQAGTCPPNAHCRQLNPHLGVQGFPCFFDTEGIDTHLNSALTGVSSFGFGGTNGRADIWGAAKFGNHQSGNLDHEYLDQIMATCPITMGPIDHISGEPVKRPTGNRKKYRADALRDEFAPYDISTHAYTGGFRWRLEDLPAEDEEGEGEELEGGLVPCIKGSWSGFTEMEEMESEGGGWYSAKVVLGETRCEYFDICLSKDESLAIYPAVHKASSKIWVNGPGINSEGRKWIIDGRDMEVSAGTVYEIKFKWSLERIQVSWNPCSSAEGDEETATALSFEHTYFMTSNVSKSKPVAMMAGAGGEGSWEGSCTIGSQGFVDFLFLRDKDWQQAIYPAKHKGLSENTPVRGPDELCGKKYFRASGRPEESVSIKLTIADAKVMVTATTESKGMREWKSLEGWERHQYSVVGSFSGAVPCPMNMDLMNPGVFTCNVTIGDDYDEKVDGFVEYFQVCMDDDADIAFYPEHNMGGSAETIVRGPDGKGADKMFFVRAPVPYASLEITLDLTSVDKRRIVTWKWTSSGYGDSIADGD